MGSATGSIKSTSSDNSADLDRQAEQQRQQRVREGTARINDIFGSQFTDDFYNSRRQSYLDFANPQVDDQYADAQRELVYALDRTGNLDSSSRSSRMSELQQLYDTNRQAVADQALTYENDARSSVESARSDLINTLNATGDAEGAANSANSRAASLSASPSYSALTNLFSDFTSALAQQAAYDRSAAVGGYRGRYSTGLFSPSSSSVRNT
jgi:hypothetical protein